MTANLTSILNLLASSQAVTMVLFVGIIALCMFAIIRLGGMALMGLGITGGGSEDVQPAWRTSWWTLM